MDMSNRRTRNMDILTPMICIFPIATTLLDLLPPRAHFRLLNMSKKIRQELLGVHFSHFRNLKILKDVNYYESFAPANQYNNSEENCESDSEEELSEDYDIGCLERFDSKKLFYTKFNDFSFEEFVIGKLMEMPTFIHPTADQSVLKAANFTRALTRLALDGTKVTGVGLFGAVRLMKNGMPRRETPGLISYFSGSLKDLSVQHCPNIEHCDVAIYLLLPPTMEVAMRHLRILRVFNAGEAPTVGPFHNKRGYGSRGKVVRDADHVNSLSILRLLFPVTLPFQHHLQSTLSMIIPQNIPNDTKAAVMGPIQMKLVKQHQAGWFASGNIHGTRTDTLKNPKTGEMVPGPFGGILSEVHESLILHSVCKYRKVRLDWGLCINGDKCHGWNLEQFQMMSQVDARTNRLVTMGNIYGEHARYHGGQPSWWGQGHGPITKLPTLLAPESIYPSKEQVQAHSEARHRTYPQFLSMKGLTSAPLPNVRPNSRNITTVIGLNGVGLHTHCATGLEQRKACGGEPCANCGIWETQHTKVTTADGRQILDLGRRYKVGELCEICIMKHTCSSCGNFYCPNCLHEEQSTQEPFPKNPFACEEPSSGFLLHPCRHHGVVCRECFENVPSECVACGKYLCMDCVYEECLDQPFEKCRECDSWYCLDCLYEGKLDTCDGERCHDGRDLWRRDERLQGCCTRCLIGECLECMNIYCRTDVHIIQQKYLQNYGVKLISPNGLFLCVYCFEAALSKSTSENERIVAWKRIGIDIKGRAERLQQAGQGLDSSNKRDMSSQNMPLQTPQDCNTTQIPTTPPSKASSSTTMVDRSDFTTNNTSSIRWDHGSEFGQSLGRMMHTLRSLPETHAVRQARIALNSLKAEFNSNPTCSPLTSKILGPRLDLNTRQRVRKTYIKIPPRPKPVKKLVFQRDTANVATRQDSWSLRNDKTDVSGLVSLSSNDNTKSDIKSSNTCSTINDDDQSQVITSTLPILDSQASSSLTSKSSRRVSMDDRTPLMMKLSLTTITLPSGPSFVIDEYQDMIDGSNNVASVFNSKHDANVTTRRSPTSTDLDAIMKDCTMTREETDAMNDVRKQMLKDIKQAEEDEWVSDSEGESVEEHDDGDYEDENEKFGESEASDQGEDAEEDVDGDDAESEIDEEEESEGLGVEDDHRSLYEPTDDEDDEAEDEERNEGVVPVNCLEMSMEVDNDEEMRDV